MYLFKFAHPALVDITKINVIVTFTFVSIDTTNKIKFCCYINFVPIDTANVELNENKLNFVFACLRGMSAANQKFAFKEFSGTFALFFSYYQSNTHKVQL